MPRDRAGSVARVPDAALLPTRADASPIEPAPAIAAWAVSWIVGPFLLASLAVVAIDGDADDPSIAAIAVASAAGWLAFAGALWWTSRSRGTGDVLADLAVRVRPIDVLAAPAGVLLQLVVVPLAYVPLRHYWPDTFSNDQIEERARDLADKAHGFTTVVLVLVVVVGAPIVEELVYRGLLQRSVARAAGGLPALVVVSLWFAAIHFQPVELVGLFLAGMLFGGCTLLTGRIGPGMIAHAAFNAAGLALVLW